MRKLRGHTDIVWALVVLPGGLLASGSMDKTVRVWEVGSGRLVRTLHAWMARHHVCGVAALVGLPGGLVASGAGASMGIVWRITDAVRHQ